MDSIAQGIATRLFLLNIKFSIINIGDWESLAGQIRLSNINKKPRGREQTDEILIIIYYYFEFDQRNFVKAVGKNIYLRG